MELALDRSGSIEQLLFLKMSSEPEAIITQSPAGLIRPSETRTSQRLVPRILLDRPELVSNKYVFFYSSSELDEKVYSGGICVEE